MKRILSLYAMFFSVFVIVAAVLMAGPSAFAVQTGHVILAVVVSIPLIIISSFVLKD